MAIVENPVMVRYGCNVTPIFSGVQHFYPQKILVVACQYVAQSKDFKKTETKQKHRPTTRARDQAS